MIPLISRNNMAGRPEPLTKLDKNALHPHEVAIFLDFDGTLADIADDPAAVAVPRQTIDALARLEKVTGGAVAIVTGRPISEIDHFLSPLNLPIAGVHGLERRGADGSMSSVPTDERALEGVAESLERYRDRNEGIFIERKQGSIALHYRKRPELEAASKTAVHEAVNGNAGLHILNGKKVIEIKAGKATKADALKAFLKEPPFNGRIPLFAGDDVTDEDAFLAIADDRGVSIKIGEGETAAAYRADSTESFRSWLYSLAGMFEQQQLTS